jgi:ubiquinone/menaquinone biosynthesis C-methylase UbiE
VGDGRQWVCGQARGEVLEIAIGTGRNLPYYPSDVRLTGVDLTPAMLEIARQRASALGREVDLRVGDAHAPEFPDGRFDTVVATLALCTIPDERRTVAEMRRVLRPGGRLLLLEHFRSPLLPVRVLQRLLDPLFVRFYGDHLLREPLDHLVTAGFVVEDVQRSKGGTIERLAAVR